MQCRPRTKSNSCVSISLNPDNRLQQTVQSFVYGHEGQHIHPPSSLHISVFFLSKKYQRTAMFNLHWATIGLNPFIYRKNHGASTEWTVSVCWFDGDRAAATPAPRINNVTASRDARKSATTRAEQSFFINFLCVVARIESSCCPKWIIAKRESEQLNIKQLYLFLELSKI